MEGSYSLVWEDQFDYEGKPDPNKWHLETGGHGFGNAEKQYYTDCIENAYVKEGKLTIVAKKEDYKNNNYTSAKLSTNGIDSWQYGRFEIKAKLPKGQGTWPAIWMLSDAFKGGRRWPLCGEIDIMEHVGRDQDKIHFSLHSEKYNHNKKTQLTDFHHIEGVSETFKIYTVEWTPEYIRFLVDNTPYKTFYKAENNCNNDTDEVCWPFDQPFYLILNIALGGFLGGRIDDAIFPQKLEVDYVRIYQKNDE
ncbi:glycoside hydrolase family 16 protein [Haloplasma contractile]|uniref:Glucan endo-13-beta-D-glucosidase protein n=1 Tax=Haloplasma contractile SSD-17B TaxID=1033810 RepID=U2E9U0_9MOLU|nr:glycoside hydrolase family 16 protein [Haloplasma contractile]ERJ11606.1 glucan endo-13-beta-D-glucosidase protein [Haloplasma contractile SSD-17B]